MPGIAGIIDSRPNGSGSEELGIMLDSMMHEPFYTSTRHENDDLGFRVGAVCIQGSFPDCMPIRNETADLVLLLSGECFVDAGVIGSLKRRGHTFEPGNAGYLVHLYEEKGMDFVADLNGWFSGVILDMPKRKAILFNDRYGMQRIYYHEARGAVFFSSEAKCLLNALPTLREIDHRGMGEYFIYDCVLDNRTLFAGIRLLPGASVWSFVDGNVEKTRYFDPTSWEEQSPMAQGDVFDCLGETFDAALPRYFSGPSLGMSLTGGLDTRMILSCRRPEPGALPCFTFGGMYRDMLDVRIARRVAEACGQTHETLRLDKTYLDEFASHAERGVYITDGVADVCKATELYMNRLSREIAPIRMTGKFGSQVMRGLTGLRDRAPCETFFAPEFTPHVNAARNTFARIRGRHGLSFFLFSEIPWFWAGFTSAELSQLMVRSPYLDNDFVRLLYQVPAGALAGPEFQLDLIRRTSPGLLDIMTDKGHGGSGCLLSTVPRRLLYKCLGIADKVYVWDRLPRSLHHPVALLDRHVLKPLHADRLIRGFGYYYHYRTWFRDELSGYLHDIVLDRTTLDRPYWSKESLKTMVRQHTGGSRNYVLEIRKVLTAELIHRTLLGSGRAPCRQKSCHRSTGILTEGHSQGTGSSVPA